MPAIAIPTLRSEDFPVDRNKVIFHQVPFSGLEVRLAQTPLGEEVSIRRRDLADTGVARLNIPSGESPAQFYERVLQEFRGGNYQVHIYDDGRMEVKLPGLGS